jgi:AcrR family transcriptional regulator
MLWHTPQVAEAAKPTRTYDSPRRRRQAAATRRAILDAAQRLFERQGYTSTTIAAIAKEADVALKTVYVAFENKSGILRALWHLLLRGDEDTPPVGDRAWYREVLEAENPAHQLELNARNSRAVKERAGALLTVIREAAPADADIAALWSRIQTDFHENQGAIVESLHAKGALRPGLDVDRATDLLWLLNHPGQWELLVVQRGWTAAEYERWFRETAAAQLLG